MKMQFPGTSALNTNILNTKVVPLLYLPVTVTPPNGTNSDDIKKKHAQVCQENTLLRDQNKQKNSIIESQNQKIKLLEEKLLEMERKRVGLEHELETVKRNLDTRNSEIKKIHKDLRNLLSDTQLELLTQKKDKVHWSAEDMAKAFTIYYFSKKCYLYLKYNVKYPLPNISTVESWASRNKVVLRIPAYEILKGLQNDEPTRKRKHF